MPRVFAIDDDSRTVSWRQVHCADEDKELQKLLANNFDLLCGEQIKPDNPRRWLLIKREMPVPDPATTANRWSIDFFFVDQDGMPTFVECKRYKDTRARREVVGQMLEYAANGQYYWDKDILRKYAEGTASGMLSEAITTLTRDNSQTIDTFLDALIAKLKVGEIRLIFFMEESPYELRSIVEFLNNQMELAEVLIIEAKQYTDGSSRVVIPLLFGFTEQARQLKKSITVSQDSLRRKWDEESFFEDAKGRHALNEEQIASIRKLYEFSKRNADEITWGTSANRASFNPKFSKISTRSPYAVYSDGALVFNLGWLTTGPEMRYKQALKNGVEKIPGFVLPNGYEYPSVSITHWGHSVEALLDVLRDAIQQSVDYPQAERDRLKNEGEAVVTTEAPKL